MKNGKCQISLQVFPAVFSVLVLLYLFHPPFAFASPLPQDTVSKGVFILHKFQQPLGRETYTIVRKNDALHLSSDFNFNDRGQEVPLRTQLTLNKSGFPVYFRIKGKTSRSSVIDSEVRLAEGVATIRVNDSVRKQKVTDPYFTISGYAPVAVQMALIKYWKQHNKPVSLPIYPAGNLAISLDGVDTVTIQNRPRVLERYFVKGLIWGNELVWTEPSGELVCLFTNDAEGDKFEAIQQGYLDLLPIFLQKAGLYGMQAMQQPKQDPQPLVIALKGGNVIDVVNGKKLLNTVILIRDGLIQQVGPAAMVKIPEEARVIDISGKTVMPGLWDMHAHFQQVEWGPAYLAAGVTTIRDCGNELDFITSVKQAISQNQGIGPRILMAGIIDGNGPRAVGVVRANTEEEAQQVVRRYKEMGFDQIKIYSSVKPEVLKAIAGEAHRQGLSVTGHVPMGMKVAEAIALGLDQINHFSFIYESMLADPKQKKVNLNDPAPQKMLKLIKEKGVVVDPTLNVYEWGLRPLDQPLDAFEPGVTHVSETLQEIFLNTGLPPKEAKEEAYLLENGKAIVLALHRMGVPIVAGTDMMVPGYSLYRELELYHAAGLSPLEAIRTATIVPARVMKKDKDSGSIESGKRADLIILDADPLEAMGNIRKVRTVVKDGVVYDPAALRKMIGFKE